ncbi:DNase I-like protein [Polyporus arcularius HHB13444]|uniref:DNase I-like protein n=1 Tax=Polyporus arcularius HHB13444 TaxID=1314778 RepID=A0A5C3NTL1_9APHY|nr:DNase I-like protein [Polyporus arcularius HHB13444]
MEMRSGTRFETHAGSRPQSPIDGLNSREDASRISHTRDRVGIPDNTPGVTQNGEGSRTASDDDASAPDVPNEPVPPDSQAAPTNRRGRRRDEALARKQAMKVATLNINGFGNLVKDHDDNKWGRIYKMMTDQRIAVLLLQETHLTEERKASLHKMFAKRIKIFHSAHPDAPTQREGVAVVVNARYLAAAGAEATEIIPGRAIQLSVQCQGGYKRHILCVYAPTSDGTEERKRFFIQLREYYEANPAFPRPELMAGDFNTVEDAIDRLPTHAGPDASLSALDDLKLSLGLMMADGWRTTNPTSQDYTFHRGSGQNAVFSRLDRIYVTIELFNNSREWRISEAGVKTDHSLVSVQLTSDQAPVVGPGRPIFPLGLLKDKPLAKNLKKRGMEALQELANLEATGVRNADANPQLVLHKFKVDAMLMARDRERAVVPKLLHEIRELEKALRKLKADQRIPEGTKVSEAAALTKQISELKIKRYKQQQQNARATHRLYGEHPTKYWSKLHKERAPRDIINAFEKNPDRSASVEAVYETDSAKMAEMARRHHNGVQRDDPDIKTPDERERDILTALDSLNTVVSDEQSHELQSEITYEDCELSLRFSKNGSAPGMDGIPFEVWKTLHARHVEDSHFPNREDFDVLKLLRAAFEDMRTNGVEATTSFADGWMAPIYKEKGERTKQDTGHTPG